MTKKVLLVVCGFVCALALTTAPAAHAEGDGKCGTGKCGGEKKPTPTPAPGGDGKCGAGKCGGGK